MPATTRAKAQVPEKVTLWVMIYLETIREDGLVFRQIQLTINPGSRRQVFMTFNLLALCFCLAILTFPGISAPLKYDVVVYGGTSGGVVAAVQASRLGKSVCLVEPGKHLGGMTASGLSWTDVGTSDRVSAIGGLSREFYERVAAHYGQDPDTAFDPVEPKQEGQTGIDYAKPPSLSFEPHVAEAILRKMLQETSATVILGHMLTAVSTNQGKIESVRTEDGNIYQGLVFIDATYEGDLMAKAGVTYTIGRESNDQYHETVNGIQGPAHSTRAGKFEVTIDPYKVPGNPDSGILPYLLHEGKIAEIGTADKRVQSYNYRVCLTDNPSNRIAIAPPDDYNQANYELLARQIEAQIASGKKLTLRDFLKYDPLQNGKYDFNNRWPISTDFLGGAHDYPEATPEERREIARAHEDYLRGFFHFLATSDRVPRQVRDEMSRFGLCRDEFTDNGGWPHQLYVREARRMVSDFVMTEHHCTGDKVAPKSIGLGTYGIDMHAVRRIVHNGQPVNEGTNSVKVPRPYPISYKAIVPRESECKNLLVPFALSASHVAFGSIRMEPVFMILSQSAATGASIAIDKGIAVQKIEYGLLKEQLIKDRQVLNWEPPSKK